MLRVLDLGEELPLGHRGPDGVGVARFSRPLSTTQRSDTLRSRAEVDPAQAAVGEAADDLVLAADQLAPGGGLGTKSNGVRHGRRSP